MLLYVFILYQPHGPGIKQRLGWQSWEVVSISNQKLPPQDTPQTGNLEHTVDWWNITKPEEKVDYSSLPLDVWSPLLPHVTGRKSRVVLGPPLTENLAIVSEIAVILCVINPDLGGDVCAPDSTSEQDAIKGKWVRVPRNLNLEGGYMSGWLVCNSNFLSQREMLICSRKYTIVAQGAKISTSLLKSASIHKKNNRRNHLIIGTKLQHPYEPD